MDFQVSEDGRTRTTGQEIRGLVIGNKLSQHARGFRLSHDSWLSRDARVPVALRVGVCYDM